MQTLPPINTSRAGCFEPPPAASCRCCGIEPKTAGDTPGSSFQNSVSSRRTGQTAAPPGRQQPSCQSAAPTLAEPRTQPCRTLSRGARQPASSCSCAEIYRRWGSHRNHESQEFPSAAAAPTPHHPRQQKQTVRARARECAPQCAAAGGPTSHPSAVSSRRPDGWCGSSHPGSTYPETTTGSTTQNQRPCPPPPGWLPPAPEDSASP